MDTLRERGRTDSRSSLGAVDGIAATDVDVVRTASVDVAGRTGSRKTSPSWTATLAGLMEASECAFESIVIWAAMAPPVIPVRDSAPAAKGMISFFPVLLPRLVTSPPAVSHRVVLDHIEMMRGDPRLGPGVVGVVLQIGRSGLSSGNHIDHAGERGVGHHPDRVRDTSEVEIFHGTPLCDVLMRSASSSAVTPGLVLDPAATRPDQLVRRER